MKRILSLTMKWFPTATMKQKMNWKTRAPQLNPYRVASAEKRSKVGRHSEKVTSLGPGCWVPSLSGLLSGGNSCKGWVACS